MRRVLAIKKNAASQPHRRLQQVKSVVALYVASMPQKTPGGLLLFIREQPPANAEKPPSPCHSA
jgi:hypothetical protein